MGSAALTNLCVSGIPTRLRCGLLFQDTVREIKFSEHLTELRGPMYHQASQLNRAVPPEERLRLLTPHRKTVIPPFGGNLPGSK